MRGRVGNDNMAVQHTAKHLVRQCEVHDTSKLVLPRVVCGVASRVSWQQTHMTDNQIRQLTGTQSGHPPREGLTHWLPCCKRGTRLPTSDPQLSYCKAPNPSESKTHRDCTAITYLVLDCCTGQSKTHRKAMSESINRG